MLVDSRAVVFSPLPAHKIILTQRLARLAVRPVRLHSSVAVDDFCRLFLETSRTGGLTRGFCALAPRAIPQTQSYPAPGQLSSAASPVAPSA